MEKELDKRLSMINEKETQKQQLEYEVELIKKDCLDIFHQRRYTEICEFADFHDAWSGQPKKITNKKYTTTKYCTTQYHWFMYWIQKRIFEDILDDVKFYDNLVLFEWSSVAIDVPFKYKDVDFRLRMPNIQAIQSFDDMLRYGQYELIRKISDTSFEAFAMFYSCAELKEKIKDSLDRRIENEQRNNI